MATLVVSENVTLDGVIQDPTGDEGFTRGGWFGHIPATDREAWIEIEFEEATNTEALLMGRRSYEFFSARWPSRGGEWADRLNGMPKYVVSSTLVDPAWNNTTVLRGAVATDVAQLKQDFDGQIVVDASRRLVWALLEHDLIDELRLMVYPVVLGGGERLFGEMSDTKRLRLVDTRRVGDGLAHLTYQIARAS